MPQDLGALASPDEETGFAGLNACLQGLLADPPMGTLTPGRQIAPGVFVNFAGDQGVLADCPGGDIGFRLRLKDRGRSTFFTVEIALPVPDLSQARYLGLRLGGRSDYAMTLSPVLRLTRGEFWEDQPLGRDLVLTRMGQDNTVCAPITRPEGAFDAAWLILFIAKRRFDMTLDTLEVLHVG